MKKTLLIFSCFFLPIANCLLPVANCLLPFAVCFSQNPDIKRTMHWYFGYGAGIDFSSGTAVADTNGKLHTFEGSAVMSDTAGNLLFYTDGDTVWNKNHQPMPNGTGLMGCGNWGSSAQAALIVPHPGNDSLFYIFTNDCWENTGAAGFRYSLMNIKLNGGLGDVISKNNLLFAPSTEALAATKHANGKDIWIMTHEFNTNRFFIYKIDDTLGLITTPIINSIGMVINDYPIIINFSYDGEKLAVGFPNIYQVDQLLDFNNSTGILFNAINLSDQFLAGGSYHSAFSPDNSKLYFMSSGSYIYQYCLNTTQDSSSISATSTVVGYHPDNSAFGQLQIAPDNKIYIASIYSDSISMIEFPDMYGLACSVKNRNFYLGGKQSVVGLPIFEASYFYDSTLIDESCDSISVIFEDKISSDIDIFPNPARTMVTINLRDINVKNATMQFYNIVGEVVKKMQLDKKLITVNVSDLSNGIYFLILQTESKIFTSKLIINNN